MRFSLLSLSATVAGCAGTKTAHALTHVSRAAFLSSVVLSSTSPTAIVKAERTSSVSAGTNNSSVPCFNSSYATASGSGGYCDNNNNNDDDDDDQMVMVDEKYPGTAVARLNAVRDRVKSLTVNDLNGKWADVRRRLLWAGGLRDLPSAVPGQGYTGHSFSDYNHVDLTTMNDEVSDNENDGKVKGIAIGNRLGPGIRIASLPELGPGGSWSTCAIGCNRDPPQDVAHIQFRSRVAFKLVWVPNANFDTFVLLDDEGKLLARGTPSDGPDNLPPLRERMLNFRIMQGSKYAVEAEKIAKSMAVE